MKPGYTSQMPFANRVDDARARIEDIAVKTPLIRLPWLDTSRRTVWAKLECWQLGSSFKIRGAINAVSYTEPEDVIVCASAGNHALGVALACQRLGRKCIAYVPIGVSEVKLKRLLALGTDVKVIGKDLFAATQHAEEVSAANNWIFISPFDNEDIVAGQGTIAAELLDSGIEFDEILVPLGGGGLVTGIGSYFKAVGFGTRVLGLHPKAFSRRLDKNDNLGSMTKSTLPSIADGLAVQTKGGQWIMQMLSSVMDGILEVEEDLIQAGIYAVLHHESILLEGAGAIGVGHLLDDKCESNGNVCLIFSGGNLSLSKLSRTLSSSIQNNNLRARLGLRAQKISLEVQGQNRIAAAVASGPQMHRKGSLAVWDSAVIALKDEVDEFEAIFAKFKDYCIREKLEWHDFLEPMAMAGIDDARRLLGVIANRDPGDKQAFLCAFRLLKSRIAGLKNQFLWRSPAYDQSRHVTFFDPWVQGNEGVNYSRYGTEELRSLESFLMKLYPEDCREKNLLATSSGMAAFQIIESFLIRHVLSVGDLILTGPYIYFEGREQLVLLKPYRLEVLSSYDAEAATRLILEKMPKVVFADPLANVSGLPTMDLRQLFASLRGRLEQDIYFVIDGTMVSAGFDPFKWAKQEPRIHIIYFESASKYLQLGMDLQMAGLCLAESEVAEKLMRIRRNTGAVLYDVNAPLFPRFDPALFQERMAWMTSNAEMIVARLEGDPRLGNRFEIGFPRDWKTLDWSHGGSVITIRFHRDGLNNRPSLEGLIEMVIRSARRRGISLTKGVSFGFNVSRISAASAMAEDSDPFLRLSVGEETREGILKLADCLGECIEVYTCEPKDEI